MGLRYGLLAALTLVLACALLWDRLHPPRARTLFPRDLPAAEDVARIVVGGGPVPEPAPTKTAAGDPAPVPEAAAVEPEETAGEREYTVAAGDTLGGIAKSTLGSARRAADLAAANGLTLKDSLRIGQVLRIPPAASPPASPGPAAGAAAAAPAPATDRKAESRVHQVAAGETLFSLARRYYGDGSRWERIANANGLGETDALRIGRALRIP